jgi:transglutaminase-like putative cysteine protease
VKPDRRRARATLRRLLETPRKGQNVLVDHVVGASLDMRVESFARLAVQICVARESAHRVSESTEVTLDGRQLPWSTIDVDHGGRLMVIGAGAGSLHIEYAANLHESAPVADSDERDQFVYLRPSRYCESDRMVGFAARHFHDINNPHDILVATSSWVGTQLEYVAGSSGPSDGAIDTLLAGRGTCRDFAHLTVALLRAMEIPARLVAVYAPGLVPMDFHAVAEAFVEGIWYVVDPTLLAPRRSLVRIATGRDAADTAFVSSYGGAVTLEDLTVTATVAGDLPTEDVRSLVQLA